MPTFKVTFDGKAFSKTIRDIVSVTKKEESKVLNRALLNIAFKAAQYTPRAAVSTVEADFRRDKIGLKLATARLRKKIGSVVVIARGRNAGKTRTITHITRKQIAAAARRDLQYRRRGLGAERAGWAKPIRQLGGSFRGDKVKPGGSTDKSFAKKATPSLLNGLISNAYYDVLDGPARNRNAAKMNVALDRAAATVERENEAYLKRKINDVLHKYSD